MKSYLFVLTLLLGCPTLQFGQTIDPLPDSTPTLERPLSRWFDISALSFSMRYRSSADLHGLRLFQFGQHREVIAGRLKMDSRGRYSINFNISSGKTMNWAYADFAGGTVADRIYDEPYRGGPAFKSGAFAALTADAPSSKLFQQFLASRGWGLSTRQLYLRAAPIDQLAFEYGSLPIEHGINTEITSYDDDGYVTGGRIRLYDPKHFFFNEIAATVGYLGDTLRPNFFDRTDRLTQSNYNQYLVAKQLGSRVKVSADFTRDKNTRTVREAALVSIPEARVVDSIRAELYQRYNDVILQKQFYEPGAGFALSGSKNIRKTLLLEGGYASIDGRYGVTTGSRAYTYFGFSLNGDSYNTGDRLFTRANLKVSPYVTLFGFYTQIVRRDAYTVARQNMNFGATIDFKNLLGDKLHLF